ncbi:helix-turn-helix domain-containing protein [Methylobacterium goesingense]|uniref:Transcriptional regulator with XRE-family HTH domain n=1 Tax=Methylobacterium goesingense TaxID=243690 RepID=A0ABV2L9N2_9HYPH|nr:hypothetical protein [Methylobacterium goesingense]GJD76177.1 hypothetical protein CFIICLFH_4427 [Methylobacterium goesingense]
MAEEAGERISLSMIWSNKDHKKEFGALICQAMIGKGFIRSTLAKKLNINPSSISRLISGGSVSEDLAFKVIQWLGVSAVAFTDSLDQRRLDQNPVVEGDRPWIIDFIRASEYLRNILREGTPTIDRWRFEKAGAPEQYYDSGNNHDLIALLAQNELLRLSNLLMVRGAAGMGKSTFFYKYIQRYSKIKILDIYLLISQNNLMDIEQEDLIRTSMQQYLENKTDNEPIIIDHLIPAVRRIAIRLRENTDEYLKKFLKFLADLIKRRKFSIVVLIDDLCDGDPVPELAPTKLIPEVRGCSITMSIQENEIARWRNEFKGKGICIFEEGSHRKLGIFLDAYRSAPVSPAMLVGHLADRSIIDFNNVLYETAKQVREWAIKLQELGSVTQTGHDDALRIKECIKLIQDEQTWEWLYLSKFGYAETYLVRTLWRVHEVLMLGDSRETMALSNVISLLCYWEVFDMLPGQKRVYIHSNLRGVFLRREIDNMDLYSVDLTQAILSRGVRFHNVKFIGCLFDRETFRKLKQRRERDGIELKDCFYTEALNGYLHIKSEHD